LLKVAVVQDGTEAVRQKDADVAGYYSRCFAELSREGYEYGPEFLADGAVGVALDGLTRDEYSCIVFSSNALLSDTIERAVLRHVDSLHRYLASGGGLVILHQGVLSSFKAMLPEDLCPDLADRYTELGRAAATLWNRQTDLLLRYPLAVDVASLCDGGHGYGAYQLFWKSMRLESLPEKLKPVLVTRRNEVLLARTVTRSSERLVVCTIPFDYQRHVAPVINAIRFACLGEPRRLVWLGPSSVANQLVTRWLGTDGATAFRAAPEPSRAVHDTDAWLLSEVDVCIAQRDDFEQVRQRPEVREFVTRGGTLMTAEPAPDEHARLVTALVGAHAIRQLGVWLYAELRAVSGWQTPERAFDLRNILGALALLWRDRVNREVPVAIDPQELDALRRDVERRLSDEHHRDDLSSSIALAESLCILVGGKVRDVRVGWMDGKHRAGEFDVALQVRAIRSLSARTPDGTFLADALSTLTPPPNHDATGPSFAQLSRVLGAVTVLHESDLLGDDPRAVAGLARLTADALDRARSSSAAGWGSVETTADLTRAVLGLLVRLEPESELARRLAAHVATGVAVVRGALRSYERNRSGVAWLARLVHALIMVEARYPIGLQRLASLRWPEEDWPQEVSPRADRSLLAYLAEENKNLRSRQEEFDRRQLPAAVGRVAASLVAVAVLLAAGVAAIWYVGFGSLWNVLGNGVLLATYLGLLVWVFGQLDRRDLLAQPLKKMAPIVAAVIPPIAALRKTRDAGD